MAQLTCKNLTLGYDNRAIQEDLNFSIDAGDYLCIVGENGSGKSTLMKTLLHLQAPISGSIELGDGLKKNEIGYLPQQTLVQRDFPASVREIVLSGCQSRCGWRPFYNKEEKQLMAEAMEKIYEKAAQLGGKVSGEHGIGFAKKPYLRESLDLETIELMSGIKKAFDPKNILNPHKVFQS